jgi:hypothetical protein
VLTGGECRTFMQRSYNAAKSVINLQRDGLRRIQRKCYGSGGLERIEALFESEIDIRPLGT